MGLFVFASNRHEFVENAAVGHLDIILYKLHLELANITDFKRGAINKELCFEAGTSLKFLFTFPVKYHV